MKILKPVLALIAAIILFACDNSNKQLKYFNVNVQTMPANDYVLATPSMIALSGNIITIYDAKLDSLFHFYDVSKEKYIKQMGRIGQGPGEFTMCLSLNNLNDNAFSVYDPNTRIEYCIKHNDKDESFSISPILKVDKLAHTGIYSINDGYIATGYYPEGRFCLIDKQGNSMGFYGEWPYRNEKEKKQKGMVKAQAYNGAIAISPDKKRFVNYILTGDIISYYNITSSGIELSKEILNSYPKYNYNNNSNHYMGIPHDNKNAYISCTSTDRLVFLLYSGRTVDEFGLKALQGNIIKIFDWNGNQLAQLNIDKDLQCITVSLDGNTIYAISYMPEPTLVKIDIPKI